MPLTVTEVVPAVGPTLGRSLIFVRGTGFAEEPARVDVLVGGRKCKTVQQVGPTYLRAWTPPNGPGAKDVTVINYDADGVETGRVTLEEAYSYERPSLDRGSAAGTALRTLLTALSEQVIENVACSPHTAFLPNGDAVAGTTLATLPGLVVLDLALPIAVATQEEKEEIAFEMPDPEDPEATTGMFAELRPTDTRDMTGTIFCVSDNQWEVLSLEEALTGFFRRNPHLDIPFNESNPEYGSYEAKLIWTPSGLENITGRVGNTDLIQVSGDFRLCGIRRGLVSGAPAATIPGMPANLPHDAVRDLGDVATGFSIRVVRKE